MMMMFRHIKEYSKNKVLKTITKYKKITPPFGYFGSKSRIAFELCNELPPHNCWVDVFCGSSSVTLAKPPAPIEIINDINSDIVNLFKQLRNNHEILCKSITLTPYSLEELNLARVKLDSDDELERARKFLIQSMMAINGIFGSERGGFSCSNSYSRNGKEARVNRWNNLPDRIRKVVDRLKDVRVENKDAIALMKKFEKRPATLMYLDPPYLGERTKGYENDANCLKFHKNLLSAANKSKAMIFLSGYENDLYEKMLTPKKGWKKKIIETSTKGSEGKSHSRSEVVWTNRFFNKALENNSIPIKLTNKELKEKKLNPLR